MRYLLRGLSSGVRRRDPSVSPRRSPVLWANRNSRQTTATQSRDGPCCLNGVVRSASFVDDLKLGELRETLLGEFGADAGLLGSAERDERRHVEMLVDPDRSGLSLIH